MARNGSGTYSLPESAFLYDTTLDETAVNNNFSDMATALTGSLAKDGQTTASARIPFAQGVGLADGSAAAPAVNFTADTDTGFYRIGTNNLGISIAGAKAWEWKADGDLESNGKNLNGVAAADFSGAVTFTGSIVATSATVTGMTVADDQFTIADEGDVTKKIAFQASGITTGTTRTLTVPDASGTLALLGAQTFTGAQTFSAAASFTSTVDLSSATTTFAANSVALGNVATIAQSTILGRAAGAGTGDVTALTAAQVLTLIGYESSSGLSKAVPSAGANVTHTHGLSAAPNDVKVLLRCTTADSPYSIGDTIDVTCHMPIDGAAEFGIMTLVDATEVKVVRGASALNIYNETNGNAFAVDTADWVIDIYARILP